MGASADEAVGDELLDVPLPLPPAPPLSESPDSSVRTFNNGTMSFTERDFGFGEAPLLSANGLLLVLLLEVDDEVEHAVFCVDALEVEFAVGEGVQLPEVTFGACTSTVGVREDEDAEDFRVELDEAEDADAEEIGDGVTPCVRVRGVGARESLKSLTTLESESEPERVRSADFAG